MTSEEAWETTQEIDRAYERYVAQVPGFVAPYAHGVGALEGSAVTFPWVNVQEHALAAVVLASVCGYSRGTRMIEIKQGELAKAIQRLAPAEACRGLRHVNLAVWRELCSDAEAGEGSTRLVAVFVAQEEDRLPESIEPSFRTGMATRASQRSDLSS